MPEEVKTLRLTEMIFRRRGSLAEHVAHFIISVALRLFFRRIETSNASVVPVTGPLIFVLNHPNGLIDPGLVFTALPRRISFLAKSTLFRLPFIGWLLRAVEALPLYRREDAGEDVKQNTRTFEACHELLSRGRAIALFPEGVSHSSLHLLRVKTGAARIALGAVAIERNNTSQLDLKIVPVGLYYTSKTSFRSEALLRFGMPIHVPSTNLDELGEPPREAVRELSEAIREALLDVTLNVETEDQMEVATRAERLYSSIYEGMNLRLPLASKFNFLRTFVETRFLGDGSSSDTGRLREKILEYGNELRRIGIAPENLSLSRHSAWYVFRHFLLRAGLLLVLLPLSLIGAIIHFPAYFASTVLSRLYSRHGIDDVTSTVKILAAMLFMPLTWLVVSIAVYLVTDYRFALLSLPFMILSGYVAMRSIEEAYDLRGWFKAVVLLVRRRKLFVRLLLLRKALHDEIARVEADAPH